ncbi:hypothetical protein ACFFKU_16720 [Kineococcus gynurae]|uniref:Uncharacterized protein n=1 Tax=Kineococcus gynurae TaxID=452979 RepID=A0ABV5LP97_9ACTN
MDAGESRPDRMELYRGAPRGMILGAALREHDVGNPDEFRPQVEQFVGAVADQLPPLLMKVPYVGAILAAGAALVLGELKKPISDFLNGLLGTDDDDLGAHVFVLSAKDMVLLACRTLPDTYQGVVSKVQPPLLGGGQGASYKICLTADAV